MRAYLKAQSLLGALKLRGIPADYSVIDLYTRILIPVGVCGTVSGDFGLFINNPINRLRFRWLSLPHTV